MIDVIIPFFNQPEYTKALLDSIYATDHGAKIAPILVDNFSRKKTKNLVCQWQAAYADLPDATKERVASPRIVSLPENKGFSAAINAALTTPEISEFVVIMHNDCVLFPNWAGEMLSCFMESDEDIAVVAPRTSYANEHGPCVDEIRKKFEAMKPSNKDRITAEGIDKILVDLYPDRQAFLESLKTSASLKTTYSPEISSFCMMTKSEYFNKYGKFDEDFWPRGYEDKMWFRSLERDGYVCMIANKAYVHHFGNVTSDGPGFSFPDVMKINEEKYRAKCLEMDRKVVASTSPTIRLTKTTV